MTLVLVLLRLGIGWVVQLASNWFGFGFTALNWKLLYTTLPYTLGAAYQTSLVEPWLLFVFWQDYVKPKYQCEAYSSVRQTILLIKRIHTVPLERRTKKNLWHLLTSVISPSWVLSLVVNVFFISKQTKISAAKFLAMERTTTNLLSRSKETSCFEGLTPLLTETRCTSLASASANKQI